jgi:hypothetical protein
LAATALLSGVVSVAAMVWSGPRTTQGASGTGHRSVKSLEGQIEARVQNATTDVFKTDIRLNSVMAKQPDLLQFKVAHPVR